MNDLVSPNEMMDSAKEHMLGGEEPHTEEDWAKLLNFVAANIHDDAGVASLHLFAQLYPFPESISNRDFCKTVWDFQAKTRKRASS